MSLLHHPSDALLLELAAGRTRQGPAAVLGAHLHACPACRSGLGRLEAVGGALLDELPPAAMAPGALAAALGRLDAPPRVPPPRARPAGIDLSAILADPSAGPRRWLAPGVWMRPLLREGGEAAYLLRTGPGVRFPLHGHNGAEYVCVLRGGFSDATGRYGPGDFACSDESLEHAPASDPDGECICLIAAEGPMRMRSLIGRLLQPFVGL